MKQRTAGWVWAAAAPSRLAAVAMGALGVMAVALGGAAGAAVTVKTVTTSIDSERCTKIPAPPDEETGDFGSFRCNGTARYRLIVEYADARDNLVVVAPSGQKRDLNLWQRVGNGFSTLGPVVEWRLENGTPVALTMRYKLANPDDSTAFTSWLVVAKITTNQTCVTDKVAPGPTQNADARKLAATAARRVCLAPRP